MPRFCKATDHRYAYEADQKDITPLQRNS